MQSLINRMLISGAAGVPVLEAIFGLAQSLLLLFVRVTGYSNGPSSPLCRHLAKAVPSTGFHSLLYGSAGGS